MAKGTNGRLGNFEDGRITKTVDEPLYMTTIPYPLTAPDVPPRPPNLFSPAKAPKKGILKKGTNGFAKAQVTSKKLNRKSHSCPDVLREKNKLLTSEEVGHLNFTVHEPSVRDSKDNNPVNSTTRIQTKRIHKRPTIDLNVKSKEFSSDLVERGARAARVESIVGVLHLLVIILSIITLSMMAKLAGEWETKRRRCPLYVKNTPNVDIYWGNEKMAPCHFTAFMPVLILIMSVTLVVFHGGILWSWRNGGDISKLLLSKNYPKIIFYLEFFELLVSLTVAIVITDGYRQTCVGFQLSPWVSERPDSCKAGYDERDDAYDITKTYSRIVGSIVTSWFTSIFLSLSAGLYFRRAKFCQNTKF